MEYRGDRTALAHLAPVFARILPLAADNPQDKVPNPFHRDNPDPHMNEKASSLEKYLSTMLLFLNEDRSAVRRRRNMQEAGIDEVPLLEGEELLDDLKGESRSPRGRLEFREVVSDIILEQRDNTYGYTDSFWTMHRHLVDALHALTGRDYTPADEEQRQADPDYGIRQEHSIRRQDISTLRESLSYIRSHTQQMKEITEGFDFYLDSKEFREALDYVLEGIDNDSSYGNALYDSLSTFCEAVYGREFVDAVTRGGYTDGNGVLVRNTAFLNLTGDGTDAQSRKKRYDYLGRIETELADLALENMDRMITAEEKDLDRRWWTNSSELRAIFSQNSTILKKAGLKGKALEDALRPDADYSQIEGLSDKDREILASNREKLGYLSEHSLDDRAGHFLSALEDLACRIFVQVQEVLSERNHRFSTKRRLAIMNKVSEKLQKVYGFDASRYGANSHRLTDYDWSMFQSFLIKHGGYRSSVIPSDRTEMDRYKEKYASRTAVVSFLYGALDDLKGHNSVVNMYPYRRIGDIARALVADLRFESTLQVMEGHQALDRQDRQEIEKRTKELSDVRDDIARLKKELSSELSFSSYYDEKAKALEARRKEMLLPSSKAIGNFLRETIAKSTYLSDPTDGAHVASELVSLFGSIVPESWINERMGNLASVPGGLKTLVSDVSVKVRRVLSDTLNTYVREGRPDDRSEAVSSLGEMCAAFVFSQLDAHDVLVRQRRQANILSQKSYTMGADGKPRLSAEEKTTVQEVFRSRILRQEDIAGIFSSLGNKERMKDEISNVNAKYGVFVDLDDITDIAREHRDEASFNKALSDRIAYRFAQDEFVRMAGENIDRKTITDALMEQVNFDGIRSEIRVNTAKGLSPSVKDIGNYIPDMLRGRVDTRSFNSSMALSSDGAVQAYFRRICEDVSSKMTAGEIQNSPFAQQYASDLSKALKAVGIIDAVAGGNTRGALDLPTLENVFSEEAQAARRAHESYRSALSEKLLSEAWQKKVIGKADRQMFTQTAQLLYDSIADSRKFASVGAYLNNSRAGNPLYAGMDYEKTVEPPVYGSVNAFENGALGPVSMEEYEKGVRDFVRRSAVSPDVEATLDGIGKYLALLEPENANATVVQSYMKLSDQRLYDPQKKIESNARRIADYARFLSEDNLARRQYERADRIIDILYHDCDSARAERDSALSGCAVALENACRTMADLEGPSMSPSDVRRMVDIHRAVGGHITYADAPDGKRRMRAFTSEEDVKALADFGAGTDLIHTLHEARQTYSALVDRFSDTSEFHTLFRENLETVDRNLEKASQNQMLLSADATGRLAIASNELLAIADENLGEDKKEVGRLVAVLEDAAREKTKVPVEEYKAFAKLRGIGPAAKVLVEKRLDEDGNRKYMEALAEEGNPLVKLGRSSEDRSGKSHSMMLREENFRHSDAPEDNYLYHGGDRIKEDIVDLSAEQLEEYRRRARVLSSDLERENVILEKNTKTVNRYLPHVAATAASLATDRQTFAADDMKRRFSTYINSENADPLLREETTREQKEMLLSRIRAQHDIIREDIDITKASLDTAEMTALAGCVLSNESGNIEDLLTQTLGEDALVHIASEAERIFTAALPPVSEGKTKSVRLLVNNEKDSSSRILGLETTRTMERDTGNRGSAIGVLDTDGQAKKTVEDIRIHASGKEELSITGSDGQEVYFSPRYSDHAKKILAAQGLDALFGSGSDREARSAIEAAMKQAVEKENYPSQVLAAQSYGMEEVENGI